MDDLGSSKPIKAPRLPVPVKNKKEKKLKSTKPNPDFDAAIHEKCKAKDFDPLLSMIDLAKTATDKWLKFAVMKEVAGYLYAKKKKAVENQVENPEALEARLRELESMSDVDVIKAYKAYWKKLKDGE